jgi:hypothetical protein
MIKAKQRMQQSARDQVIEKAVAQREAELRLKAEQHVEFLDKQVEEIRAKEEKAALHKKEVQAKQKQLIDEAHELNRAKKQQQRQQELL